MPDLLLEFLCEEIPARMQRQASTSLAKLLEQALHGAEIPPDTGQYKLS